MNEFAGSTEADPLRVVADALDSAVNSTKDGVDKVRETAAGALPAVGEFFSKASYNTCYGIAFGVVYPAMLLVRAIPKDNAAVHGFVDGAQAAMDSLKK